MNDARRTHRLEVSATRRAQRRADAVVAQYLHELSDRRRTPSRKLEAAAVSEVRAEAAPSAGESR